MAEHVEAEPSAVGRPDDEIVVYAATVESVGCRRSHLTPVVMDSGPKLGASVALGVPVCG